MGDIPLFRDIFPVFVDFRNVSGEAHRTTKFLDRRRFQIAHYIEVYYGANPAEPWSCKLSRISGIAPWILNAVADLMCTAFIDILSRNDIFV